MRLTEADVLCSILKWCWSRLPHGVVSWPIYEAFQIGEKESGMARNAFATLMPIAADSPARQNIICDFFDVMSAVAAHGKMNGLGGRKLSRLAGWWAFEHMDGGNGFESGYRSWQQAADASSHLFFAYLRSLSPEMESGMALIERIPRSLQALLASTEYPPEKPALLQRATPRVVMLVDAVSPTPFSLLRRAKHFEYRDNDRVLRQFSEFDDPVEALTAECRRVLAAISATNSSVAKSRHHHANRQPDEAWSAFQNMGFGEMEDKPLPTSPNGVSRPSVAQSLRSEPRSRNADQGRPTTPSWADFLSSGFAEDEPGNVSAKTLLLPPSQVLPPIGSRAATPSQRDDENLAPGELAAITTVDLDDVFWWVWMTSLAGEEPAERKAVFGRCALIETNIMNGRWLIMEEQVRGASPDPTEGVYIAPKKGFFSTLTKRGRLSRKRSMQKPPQHKVDPAERERKLPTTSSKISLAPDQQEKIKQAAAALKKRDPVEEEAATRRGRENDPYSSKTHSTLSMGLQSEAGPAMKWTNVYDKHAIRAKYLGDEFAGRGASRDGLLLRKTSSLSLSVDALSGLGATLPSKDLPGVPTDDSATGRDVPPTTMPPQTVEPNTVSPERSQIKEQAQDTPLPDSAFDKEISVESPCQSIGRKPIPRPEDHPALRSGPQPTLEETPSPSSPQSNTAVRAAQAALQGAKDSAPAASGKPAKSNATSGGGFKRLFGKKKGVAPPPNRDSMDLPGAHETKHYHLAPTQKEPTRRLSLMRRRPPPSTAKLVEMSAASAAAPNASSMTSESPATLSTESHGRYDASTSNVSAVDPQDRAHAEREFSRFDQGPPQYTSAVEDDDDEDDDDADRPPSPAPAPQSRPTATTKNTTTDAPFLTPAETAHNATDPMDGTRSNTTSTLSSTSVSAAGVASSSDAYAAAHDHEHDGDDDDDDRAPNDVTPLPVAHDRWATIRENAARRAARATEDESRNTNNRTRNNDRAPQSLRQSESHDDEGETSGEESTSSHFVATPPSPPPIVPS